MPLRREIARLDRAAGARRGAGPLRPVRHAAHAAGHRRLAGRPAAQRHLRRARRRPCAPPACRCCTSAGWARSSTRTPQPSGAPYVVVPYADRMDLAYAAADLVVARAGANTVCELTAVGLPAVYVPLPIGNGEQRVNAADVVAAGGGLLVDDGDVTPAWVGRRAAPSARRRASGWSHGRGRRGVGEREADERLADMVALRSARHEGGPPVSTPQHRASTSRADVPAPTTLGRVHFIAIGGAGMSGVARIMLARGIRVTGSRRQGRRLVLRALAAEGAGVARRPRRRPRRRRGHRRHLLGDPRVQRRARRRPRRGAAGAAPLARPWPPSCRVDAGSPSPAPTARPRRPRCSPSRCRRCGADPSFAVGGELAKHGTNAHHGTGDGLRRRGRRERRLVPRLPARGRDRHQRAARPPRLLRHLRGRPGRPTPRSSRTIAAGGLLVDLRRRRGLAVRSPRSRAPRACACSPTASTPDADVRLGEPAGSGLTSGPRICTRTERPCAACRSASPGGTTCSTPPPRSSPATAGLGQDPDRLLAGLARLHRHPPPVRAQGRGRRRQRGRRLRPQPRQGRRGRRDRRPSRPRRAGSSWSSSRTSTRAPATSRASSPPPSSPADVVVVMDVYAAREDPVPGHQRRPGGRPGRRPRRDATYVPSWSQAAPTVAGLVRPGDLVLTVGAGDVTMVGPEVLRLLAEAGRRAPRRRTLRRRHRRTERPRRCRTPPAPGGLGG